MINLYDTLSAIADNNLTPSLKAYNRIDGPGSSLDLREFQEAFWSLQSKIDLEDSSGLWTRNLPRTVAMTVDVGCKVIAKPLRPGQIGIVSKDYDYEEELSRNSSMSYG